MRTHHHAAGLVLAVLLAGASGCKKGPPCQRADDLSVVACLDNSPVAPAEVAAYVDPVARGAQGADAPRTRTAALEHAFRVRLFAVEARRRHMQVAERAPVPIRRVGLYHKLLASMATQLAHESPERRRKAVDDLYARLRTLSRIEIFPDALAAVPVSAKTPQ